MMIIQSVSDDRQQIKLLLSHSISPNFLFLQIYSQLKQHKTNVPEISQNLSFYSPLAALFLPTTCSMRLWHPFYRFLLVSLEFLSNHWFFYVYSIPSSSINLSPHAQLEFRFRIFNRWNFSGSQCSLRPAFFFNQITKTETFLTSYLVPC